MNEDELADALDGLHAYDTGSKSSGIHDERLRIRVRDHLQDLPDRERRALLARIGRELYLTERKIAQQYGLEDVKHFFDWLDDQGMYF